MKNTLLRPFKLSPTIRGLIDSSKIYKVGSRVRGPNGNSILEHSKLQQAFVLLLMEVKYPRRLSFVYRTLKKICEGFDFTSTRESGAKTLWDPLARLSDLREIRLPCEFFNINSHKGE